MSRLAFALSMLTLAAGCASARTTFNTRADLAGTAPVKRLFVMSHARSAHFGGTVYEAFSSKLGTELTACGVEGVMYSPGELDLDVKEQVQKIYDGFKPDVVLVIRRAGGNVSTGSGGSHKDLNFDLEALDLRAKKTVWKGRSTFSFLTSNMFTSDEGSGQKLAAELIGRMAGDGLLKGCPPPAPKT
jgi:hypothetical protein